MIKFTKDKLKGQSTLEYSLVFVCLVAACIAMRSYVQRSVQGGLRQASDQIGIQYSSEMTDADITVKFESDAKMKQEMIQAFDPITKVDLVDIFGEPIYAMEDKPVGQVKQTTERKGYEKLGKFKANLF